MQRLVLRLAGLCALTLSCGGSTGGGLSREEAGRRVVEELVDTDDPTIVFSHPDAVGGSTSLVVGMPEHIGTGDTIAIEQDAWFFWIDDEPGARFDHPTRYVLVDRSTGELTVHDAKWWPILDGQPLWIDAASYWDDGNWVHGSESGRSGELAPMPEVVGGPCEPGYGTALVINGHESGENGGEDMAFDAANMTTALEGLGFDVTNAGETAGGDVDIVQAGTDAWFDQKAAELGAGDNLVIYITGHGSTVTEDFVGTLGEGEAGGVYSKLLANQLAKFDPGVEIIVIVDACHSGAMLGDLVDVADLAISAASDDQSSYGDLDDGFLSIFGGGDSDTEDQGGEFTAALTRSMREIVDDPESRGRVEDAANNAGGSFMGALLGDAGLRARMYDLAFQRGWSEPQFRAGSAKTRPVPGNPTPPTCDGDPGDTMSTTDPTDPTDPTDSDSDTSSDCEDADVEDLANVLGDILGTDVSTSVCASAEPLPDGNQTQHSDGQQTATAEEEVDFVLRGTILGVDLPGDVPCGPGNGFEVLCTGETLAIDGPAAVFYAKVGAPIDFDEPTFSYQFGWVFDTDGDPANDYEPGASYPDDFFGGTDYWLYTVHNAGEGWYTWASSGDEGFTNVPSSERIVIAGDVVLLIVDEDEITPKNASWRMTAFRHLGDYGASLEWSGDVVPAVSEGLTPVE